MKKITMGFGTLLHKMHPLTIYISTDGSVNALLFWTPISTAKVCGASAQKVYASMRGGTSDDTSHGSYNE